MSGRKREGASSSLFPFLAVLICTLGTLILMLAILARDGENASAASIDAPATAEAVNAAREFAEADAEIGRQLDEAIWHRDKVVKFRDDQTAEIDERRIKRAHLEDHLRRLRDELKRLEAEVNATQDKTKTEQLSQSAIDALKAKIADEKTKIEKLQSEMQSKTPRIVIVPHKGPNGTDRRPIYIECRAKGVYLQPGDIGIDIKYLAPELPGTNPLESALQAFRLHAMQDYGDSVAPYPLIVVRPDGIEAYAVVRHAMQSWEDQFGYELVPEDVKLAFPEPDAVLTEHVEQAIAQAVERQQQLIAQGGSGSGSGGRNRFIGTADKGSTSETYSPGDNGTSAGTGVRPASELPVLSARNMNGQSHNGLDHAALASGANSGKSSQLGSKRTAEAAAANAASANAAKGDAALSAEAKQLAESRLGTNQSLQAPTGSALASSKNTTSRPSYSGLNAPAANDSAMDSDAGADADENSFNGDKFAPPSDIASRSRAPSASTDPNAPIGGTQAFGSAGEANPTGAAAQATDKNQTANQQTSDPSQAAASPSINVNVNGQTASKSMVKRGGKNWALPSQFADMIGTSMVRIIRVECYEDRLILLPEGGKGATNIYGFSDGDIDRASLELATAIRDRVERWGAAMPGGKWHPMIEVKVATGGEVRFRQLQRLMDGSGIEIESKGVAK